ncbi:hypothetical protein DPMN_087830 [Dreissena polymorpha]|uniref:Uncharacterized protein n=1 Tax=Dreissena polymorpha TaxID=45954 RepID=A0A9D4QVY8_DREPO|nr:hypothetical protein DPMN_087830 [Dreissena polymorpha]
MGFNGFPDPLGPSKTRADPFSVAHVRPRTYTGITDLLLLNLAWLNATSPSKKLYTGAAADARAIYQARVSFVIGLRSRDRAPPISDGHAPPPTESRKSSQSVNPHSVRAG